MTSSATSSTTPTALPRCPADAASMQRPRRRSRLFTESAAVFFAALAWFTVIGVAMMKHNVVFSDALSRVGNAYYVLYSRDPHLPAIGFVWNPLPSLVELPLLPFKAIWPQLSTIGAAGVVQSVLAMAGATAVLANTLRKLGATRSVRLALVVAFVIQPMIMLYAGSGLSEAMFIFFLLLCVNQLISWLEHATVGALVGAGLALAGGYLTRYESVPAACAAVLCVAVVSWRRARHTPNIRRSLVGTDVAIVGAPFAVTFVAWSMMSKIIVGEWLPTFSSVYGNSAQVRSGSTSIRGTTGQDLGQTLDYLSRQLIGLAPLLGVLLVWAAVVVVRRRQLAAIAVPLVLGAVLAFDNLTLIAGSSFGWLRFQIMAIPLMVLLAGTIAARPESVRKACPARRSTAIISAVLATVAVLVSLPTQFALLTDTRSGLAREEAPMMVSLFRPDKASKEDRKSLLLFHNERQISADIDRMNLPDGSVLTDTAYAYSVVLASKRPKTYVVTSDRDFEAAVNDPVRHHIRYLLVSNFAIADALQRKWPTLYDDGGGVATLVKTYTGVSYGNWRLYRVNG